MSTLVLLLVVPLLGGALCFLGRSRVFLERVNLVVFAGTLALAVRLARQVLAHGTVQEWNAFLYADALSALVIALTAFAALACTIYAIAWFRDDERQGRLSFVQIRLYYALTPLFVAVMFLVALANNLGVMWAALEGTTLASVLLTALYNRKTSLEAAWKYIVIGSIGISLALFGTILAYDAASKISGTESLQGLNWSFLVEHAGQLDGPVMRLAFVLVLIGYGTKAGLVPMHTWKPDVYSETPLPSAALLAAAVLNCALYGIIRFHVLTVRCLGAGFSGRLLLFFGLASLAVAVPFILVQRNFRRLLAYSSIDHTGIMVAALGFGGPLGALGAMLHMSFHSVTKPLLFFCAGNVQQHFGSASFRHIKTAVIHRLPLTAVLFLLGTLAVTGTPPFSIFQSEFTVLLAAVSAGKFAAAVIFVVCVITIFCGFLYHMARLNLGPRSDLEGGRPLPPADPHLNPLPGGERKPEESASAAVEPWGWRTAALLFVAAPVCLLGFWVPPALWQLIEQAARIIGGAS